MIRSTLKNFASLVLVVASLAACAPAKNSLPAASPAGGGGTLGPNGVAATSCHGSAGRVYDPVSAASFESKVKALISATASPSLFGAIDGSANGAQTCVALEGHLSLAANGQLNITGSSMKVTVYDSFAVTGNAQGKIEDAYVINFAAATSGTVVGKTFTLQFTDEFGTIQFAGDFSMGVVTGKVQFQNYKNADGAAPTSGTLGEFSIPKSSFVY